MKGVAYETILIIGVLVAVGFSLLQLRGIFYGQQLTGKEEVVYAFAKDLESVVDKAVATTGDAAFVYYPSIKQYSVAIRNNTVTITDRISNLSAYFSKYFTLVDNSFEDCEKIFVLKKEDKIFITCKCFELGEACSDSLQCCSSFCNKTSGKCEEMPVCPRERICPGAPGTEKIGGKDCCPTGNVCDKQHCCPVAQPKWCEKPITGNPRCMNEVEYKSECIEETCSPTTSQCFNNWHWKNYDGTFTLNVNGYVCDYYEVCHPDIRWVVDEIVNCCNDKCVGSCHSMCNRALSESGLSFINTPETRKKCYGLYTIYGLDGAAKWMIGYNPQNREQPASIMLNQGTWMCTGYSIALTTLLRSVGYNKNEVYTVAMMHSATEGHAFNLVKFPGEANYRFVDTVGNILYISGISSSDPYRVAVGACRTKSLSAGLGCQNDEGVFNCPPSSNIYLGASC